MPLISQRLDFKDVILRHDEQLSEYVDDWRRRFEEESDMSGVCLLVPCFGTLSSHSLLRAGQTPHARFAPNCSHCKTLSGLTLRCMIDVDHVLCATTYSFTNYSRLVMYSFGFQQAFRRGIQTDDRVYVEKVRATFTPNFFTGISIHSLTFNALCSASRLPRLSSCLWWMVSHRPASCDTRPIVSHLFVDAVAMTHSHPPGHFIFGTFASAFLLKVHIVL